MNFIFYNTSKLGNVVYSFKFVYAK